MRMQVLPHSGYLSVVLVGLGHIAAKHVVVLAQHPRIRLVATVDPLQAERTGFFASLDETVVHGTDLGAVLDALNAPVDAPVPRSVDAQRRLVLVATPNGTHIDLARLAVDRGWHVLVEKPLGLDPTACADLVDAARSRGRVLAVAMQNRFGPAVRALKESVDRGQLGALRMVQIECLWNRDEKYYNTSIWRGSRAMDGGVLFTQFSHFIDLLLWLLGRPSDFSLMASNQAHQDLELDHDSGVLSMRWPNGTLGTMVYTTAAPPGRASSGFTLLGSAAGVRLSGQYMDHLEWLTPDGAALTDQVPAPTDQVPASVSGATTDFEPTTVSGATTDFEPTTVSVATTDPPTTQFLMWDHLCGVILDQQALLLPPEEAMEVVRFIHDIHQAHS
jgi:UDP-N-acetyl-2-amino-2-deoxyglucuronate dehydrogenase